MRSDFSINMHAMARPGTRWSTDKRHMNATGSLRSCLQQSAFMKVATSASRCGGQVSSIDVESPPSVSWRVTLLPKLFPFNSVKEELRVNRINEDEERVESNSIDSSFARTTQRIGTDCREFPSVVSHNKAHSIDASTMDCTNGDFYGDGASCVGKHFHIVEPRSLSAPRPALSMELGSLPGACQVSDDSNEDESCKFVVSTYIQTEGLGTALLETQTTSNFTEGGMTPRKCSKVSPITKASWHANKTWATMQQPVCSRVKGGISAINKLRESKERKQMKRVERHVIDSKKQTSTLEDVSHLSHVDSRESRHPSRVQLQVALGAPSQRVRAPRPLWATLRNRTLKVTQEDPSIFSPGVPYVPPPSRASIVSTSKQKDCWYIINRRIFGIREVSRHKTGIQPEWVIFGGGIPPAAIKDRDRWTLRLGHAR